MTARGSGLLILAVHLGLVCAVAGKYALDLATFPRVVASAQVYSSNSSRYIGLLVCPESLPAGTLKVFPVMLSVHEGKLSAAAAPGPSRIMVSRVTGCLMNPVNYYLEDGVAVPSDGTRLQLEVVLPHNELPRPLRILSAPAKL